MTRTTRTGRPPQLEMPRAQAGAKATPHRGVSPKKVDTYDAPKARGRAAAAPAAKANPGPVFDLIDQYDLRGLRAHLKAHPEAVKARNKAGDTPLHAAADRGAVLLAEVLTELGASPVRPDARGLLPGHRAASQHPRTAAFLFERALAHEGPGVTWRSPAQIDALLAPVLADGAQDEALDALAAKLSGIPRSELNAPREIVKNRTHLEAVKGEILEQKSEGWWQDRFAPQRIRSLLRAIGALERGEAKAPEGTQARLVSELSTQLDLLQTGRRVLAMRRCSSAEIRWAASTLEARRMAPRILAAEAGREHSFALGWAGHAIYAGFVKAPANPAAGHPQDTLLVRVDNRGGGARVAHDKDAGGDVLPRALHIPLALAEQQPQLLQDLLARLFDVKSNPESKADDFYAVVADFKRTLKAQVPDNDLVESLYGVPEVAALPAQIAGNCVVANTFPGLASRLGDGPFEWFRSFELGLSRALVDQFASLNAIIDDECKERDRREIGKALDRPGPWAEALEAILGADGRYDRAGIAAHVSAEQLERVIENKDTKALRLLLAHGAKANLQGEHDRTPLHCAARLGDVAACQALLEHGSTVNAMDDAGDTPLHLAIQSGSHATVALLLDKGADRERENKAGLTPREAIDAQVNQTLLIAQALRGGEARPATKKRARPFAPTGT